MHALARALDDPSDACYNTHFAAVESVESSIQILRAEPLSNAAEIAALRLELTAQNVERKLADCADIFQ